MTTSIYKVGDMVRQRGNSIPHEVLAVDGKWLMLGDTPGRKPTVWGADEVEMVPDQTLPEAAAALAEAWRTRPGSDLNSLHVEIADLIRASDLVELSKVMEKWTRSQLQAEYQARCGVSSPDHDTKIRDEILDHARKTCTPWETAA
jgi:hypothetical protein